MAGVQPLSGAALAGFVLLRPLGTGDYQADVTLYGTRQPPPRPLTLLLARGSCARQDAVPAGGGADVLLRTSATATRMSLAVQAAWLAGPLVLLAEGPDGARLTCADLPVEAVRLRQPVAGATPAAGVIQPAPGWHVGGQTRVWATPSGDRLLRAEVAGPAEEVAGRLLWFVVEGPCAAGEKGKVFWKENPPLAAPGRQAFSFVLDRQWTARPLALAAYVEGGGPLAACGDLPVPAAP